MYFKNKLFNFLYFKFLLLFVFILLFSACSLENNSKSDIIHEEIILDDNIKNIGSSNVVQDLDWRDYELKDIITGEKFKISNYKGKTLLIETFAVWCPKCTEQQKQIRKLHDKLGSENLITISLDTDPNEDVNKVKEHIIRNNLKYLYAISPIEMTQKLVDEFGINIVNAPTTPVILICEDFNLRLLGSGIKSSDELEKEINLGC